MIPLTVVIFKEIRIGKFKMILKIKINYVND